MASAETIISRLQHCRPNGAGKWMACCPAHQDKSPSLSISELQDGRVLIHCFAGCGAADVLAAIGLDYSDLYPETGDYKPSQERPMKPDEVTYARMVVAIARETVAAGGRLTEAEKAMARQAYVRLASGSN